MHDERVEWGLWGRGGLRAAPSRRTILFLLSASLLGYMFALLINGAAARILRPRFALPDLPSTADPLAGGMAWVVRVLDPMYLLTSLRAAAAWLLCAYLWARNDVPWRTGVGEDAGVREDAMLLQPKMWVPFIVGLCNSFG
jgi:hypothetical protein